MSIKKSKKSGHLSKRHSTKSLVSEIKKAFIDIKRWLTADELVVICGESIKPESAVREYERKVSVNNSRTTRTDDVLKKIEKGRKSIIQGRLSEMKKAGVVTKNENGQWYFA